MKIIRTIVIVSIIICSICGFASADTECSDAINGDLCDNIGYVISALTDHPEEFINWDQGYFSTSEIITEIANYPSDANIYPFFYNGERLYISTELEDYEYLCLLNQGFAAFISGFQSCYPTEISEEPVDCEVSSEFRVVPVDTGSFIRFYVYNGAGLAFYSRVQLGHYVYEETYMIGDVYSFGIGRGQYQNGFGIRVYCPTNPSQVLYEYSE